MAELIATGQWCTECNFFEEFPDKLPGGRCAACGCLESTHVNVKVVTE